MSHLQESYHPLWPTWSCKGPALSHMWLTFLFKSQTRTSSVTPFPTLPTFGYTCQHSPIFPAFLGCYSKSGQVWPCGVEPIISKLSHRLCNQGELPHSYIMVWSHSLPPGSKHNHSYWTYLWNQLNVIDMLNILEVICIAVAMQNNSQWPCSMCLIPQLRLVGVRTSYIYIFF